MRQCPHDLPRRPHLVSGLLEDGEKCGHACERSSAWLEVQRVLQSALLHICVLPVTCPSRVTVVLPPFRGALPAAQRFTR